MKKHIVVDRTRTFSVVLTPEPEGGFTVRVPALPEIATHGKTEQEALAMAKDAIHLALKDCMHQGPALTPAERAEFIDSLEIPEGHVQAENFIDDDFKAFRDA
jgi:antitoxin HicB